MKAYGVDAGGVIRQVWQRNPPGTDGQTVGGLVVRVPDTGVEVLSEHTLWTWNTITERADPVVPALGPSRQDQVDAFDNALDQAEDWKIRFGAHGGTVADRGRKFVVAGEQGLKAVFEDATITPALKLKIAQQWVFGASDITSPSAFAAAIANYPQDPTMIILWVSKTTGERLPLASALQLGALVSSYRSYNRYQWLTV